MTWYFYGKNIASKVITQEILKGNIYTVFLNNPIIYAVFISAVFIFTVIFKVKRKNQLPQTP